VYPRSVRRSLDQKVCDLRQLEEWRVTFADRSGTAQGGCAQREVREGIDDQRVGDAAVAQHRGDLCERRELDRDDLAAVELLRVRALGIEREERVEEVVLDRGIRRHHPERLPARRGVAGLLDELALRGG